ncbi:thiamine pyrophosphate-binding protein [Candidatus Rariloculus sp.]|uniref:thiamine pyrophosphate-binding protein n=1 Tax=Candidatus Rariloculus sp. TaxID=3101265 RepID=UPI003D14DF15
MTAKTPEPEGSTRVNRREFIAGASVAGAGLAGPGVAEAQTESGQSRAAPPSEAQLAREQGSLDDYSSEESERYFVDRPGSDFMVDLIKSLNVDYVTTNPGSSFRGLHESIVNYGGNRQPELLTCVHEEQAVAMAHGYAKVAGKPMMVACHGTVGLQHAAMAVYNAWCDRVPIVIIAGNHLDGIERRVFEWVHSAQDCVRPIRDYIKWDDTPPSLPHFAESLVRGYKIAMTPPTGPVAVVADGHIQEMNIGETSFELPRLSPTQPPRGDDNAVREAARMLVAAESPVIMADRVARDQAGVDLLVDLAETLQAPVIDRRGRMNFPSTHYLSQGGNLVGRADLILGLELNGTWGVVNTVRDRVHRDAERIARPDVKIITIGAGDLFLGSNYQDFGRYYGNDLTIAGDAQATLPALIEAVREALPRNSRAMLEAREANWRAAHAARHEAAMNEARYAWTASPVSTARLAAELWDVVRERDWALVSGTIGPLREIWEIERHYQYIGGSGGAGMGYGAPAAVGAALAHREAGRLPVNIQKDGDLMYVPGALWTAAHHGIPLLSVMHNNRAYHQEVMHLQRMNSRRRRGVDGSARVGNVFENPDIDFATMAKSMGLWASGPITDPDKLGPVLREALAMVESGVPALVDVVSQPR